MSGHGWDVLLSWSPFVLIIIAYILCVRVMRQRTAGGLTMIDLYEHHLVELRRTNATLEKIATVLDKARQ
jgi:hypothetical protein